MTTGPVEVNRRGFRSVTTQQTIEWIKDYGYRFGDKLPDSDKTHLPSCLTMGDVYLDCKQEFEFLRMRPPSKAHFYKIWRSHVSYLAIPKVRSIV